MRRGDHNLIRTDGKQTRTDGNLSPSDEAAIVAAVRAVARSEIVPRFRSLHPTEIEAKTGPDDLVTLADHRAEAALTEALGAILPRAAVIGEEAVASGKAGLDAIVDAETCVVIDPIDGTWNFAHGLGAFGVIVAVLRRGEPVFGLLYDPLADDWVTASAGRGAIHGRTAHPDRPLRLRNGPPLAEARGVVELLGFEGETRGRAANGLAELGNTTSFGSSCHEYRLAATGRLRFIVAGNPTPWDHLAGALVMREAGGCAIMPSGARFKATEAEAIIAADTEANARELVDVLGLVPVR